MASAAFALALLLFSFTAIPSSNSFFSLSLSTTWFQIYVFYLSILILTLLNVGANWCVCKDGSDAILQKTLDYACGAGADCNPLHQNAPCFQPNTVRAHCSYAVNSYFQKKGQAPGSCDFAGTATPVASDPSKNPHSLFFFSCFSSATIIVTNTFHLFFLFVLAVQVLVAVSSLQVPGIAFFFHYLFEALTLLFVSEESYGQ